MSALDDKIDALYQLAPAEFTAARNALAKSLKGDDAARVKRFGKPTVVPWAVNQLYWRDRRAYDRVMASGHALRTAQIAALKGRQADLRTATAEHRAALAAALASATQLSPAAGVHPDPEPLSRMLEALSLAPTPPASAGRFTEVLQPAGFEALAGVTPAAHPRPSAPAADRHAHASAAAHERGGHGSATSAPHVKPSPHHTEVTPRHTAAEEKRRQAEAAAARKAADDAVRAAKRQHDRARATEDRAQAQVDAARQHLARVEAAHAAAHQEVERAAREVSRAEAARKALDR